MYRSKRTRKTVRKWMPRDIRGKKKKAMGVSEKERKSDEVVTKTEDRPGR